MKMASAPKTQRGQNEWVDRIYELMDAVDSYIPTPERELDKPFLMAVEDVFSIKGRGAGYGDRCTRFDYASHSV